MWVELTFGYSSVRGDGGGATNRRARNLEREGAFRTSSVYLKEVDRRLDQECGVSVSVIANFVLSFFLI